MLHKRSEKGQAIILIVFSIIGLVALTGLAVDGGRGFMDRRSAQGTVDSAAWAAALAKARSEDFSTAALSIANQNGYADGVNSTVTVTPSASPASVCLHGGTDIKVEITSHVKTFFGPVIGIREMTNKVSASTRSCDVYSVGGNGLPLYSGNAIYATKTATCGNGVNSQALYSGGSSQLQVWGGGMGSASTDGNCVNFHGGNVQLKLSEASPKTCADINMASSAGTGQVFSSISGQDGCGKQHYNVAAPTAPGDLGITCSSTATKSGSSLSPGNYTGTFPPSGVSTLQPGTYCVNGDFTLNGGASLHGSGVTIVMNNGSIKWNGGSEVQLTGPTSGTYKGLTIYAPPTNTSQMTMNGNTNVVLEGTMLAQNAPCDFIGAGQVQKVELQMICATWQMNGNADVQIVYDASKLYSPPAITIDPVISLIK